MSSEKERIQKIIARFTQLSRRKAEEAISAGKVRVNGVTVTELGSKADPAHDKITLDGKLIDTAQGFSLVALNKPRSVLSTRSDPRGRKTVMEFLESNSRLKPVGRLDYDSEGLLLLTDHGELLLRMTHPRYGIEKIYSVKLARPLPNEQRARLLKRVVLSDGPGKFKKVVKRGDGLIYEITVSEGRNRFVRKMFEAVGNEVLTLRRIQHGNIKLSDLRRGKTRTIEGPELKTLLTTLKL